MGRREIAQKSSGARIRRDRLLERTSGGTKVALPKRVQALAIGGRGLLDGLLHQRCLPAGRPDGKVDE